MSDTPERIWAFTNGGGLRVWTPRGPAYPGSMCEAKYIRADAVQAMIDAAVKEERKLATRVASSLNAAISLLERGGPKAAPSDRMFRQMLLDYHKALDDWTAAIRGDT